MECFRTVIYAMLRVRAFTCSLRVALALGLIAFANLACGENRISGTYVAHGSNFTTMLQLTQTDNGQLAGVMSNVAISAEGKIDSGQCRITGEVDNGEITLSFHFGLLQDSSAAGTISGTVIRLQDVGSTGDVLSRTFERGSPAQFKIFADQLKSKAEAITLTDIILKRSQEFEQAIRSAEAWILSAESHAQKIPGVKDYYRKIEDEMRALVAREGVTRNSVTRTQISVTVIQGNVVGIETDVKVNGLWDELDTSGTALSQKFANYPSTCGPLAEFKKRGATPQVVEAWANVCQQLLAERAKFTPIFERVMEQRADLKSFQSTAKSRREALVQESSRIQ